MRIIVVNDHGSVTGGAAQVAIASLNALADAGHNVTFVSSVAPVDKNIDTQKVRVVNFGFDDLRGNPSRLKAAIHGIWDIQCAKQFGSVLDEYDRKNTVIHLHTWVKSLSSSVIYEALKRNFKVVVTLHDYFTVCPNGGLYNYTTQQHCAVRAMSVTCALTNCDPRSFPQKMWRFVRHTIQNKLAAIPGGLINFISVSDYSESLLRPYLQPDANFFRVRNPINIEKTPFRTDIQSDAFTFVGRLSPEKGATLFARAASMANVKAVFVGQGDEAEAIRKVNPEAELAGWKDRLGVISHMQASRAIVFPSLLHETQGLVVTEAAALGIPAIVSDGCAAREGIVDGETGLLFRAGDIKDLVQKINELGSDPPMALRLGQTAYDKYWANPSTLNSHVHELINCYAHILNIGTYRQDSLVGEIE